MPNTVSSSLYEYCALPIQYHDLHESFLDQQAVLWRQNEIDYSGTADQWDKLTETDKHIIEQILALFSQLDNIVNNIGIDALANKTQFKEAKSFYAVQKYIETVHALAYAEMASKCINNSTKLEKIFQSIQNYKSVKEIVNWVKRYFDDDDGSNEQYLIQLIATVCLEGLIFLYGFVFILWFKQNNKLTAIGHANEWILRDERLHTEFGIKLYNTVCEELSDHYTRLPYEKVLEIINSAIDVSNSWVDETIPNDYEGLTKKKINDYVKCIADEILVKLYYPAYFNTKHECSWMIQAVLNEKTNFFEKHVTAYMSVNDEKLVALTEF